MAKKKAGKKGKERSKQYEEKLAISGTLDEVLRVSIDSAKPPQKKK